MFDNKGNFLAETGSSGKGAGQLDKPEDVAVDNKGGIYVTDTRNSRIQIFHTSS